MNTPTAKNREKSLAERAKMLLLSAKHPRAGRNRFVFLTLLPEIEKAINKEPDLPMKIIWLALKSEGKIDFSYRTFMRFFKKYRDGQKNHQKNKSTENPADTLKQTHSKKEKPKKHQKTEYAYNPKPNEEELT